MIKHECINNLNARLRHFIVRDVQKPGTIKKPMKSSNIPKQKNQTDNKKRNKDKASFILDG